ncbi:hypothetical protein VTK56DRAFT_1121 [Thermocarpiscus australiensis]
MPPPTSLQQGADPGSSSLPLDQSHMLLTSFNSFFTVAIHNILYYRNIYPPATFLSTKAYNLPVHQNRHPKVCAWIRDAVDAVAAQLSSGQVSRIAIVIHSPVDPPLNSIFSSHRKLSSSDGDGDPFSPSPSQPQPESTIPPGAVLERWLFDTSRFPSWPVPSGSGSSSTGTGTGTKDNNRPAATTTAKAMRDFSRVLARESRAEETRDAHLAAEEDNTTSSSSSLRWADLDEQLRGALRRMAHAAEGMAPLPEGCTFTVAVELKEAGRAPIGHPQAWIPSEPNLQPASRAKEIPGEDIGGARTRPVRSVEVGPLFFECWVEEGKAKEVLLRMMKG